MSKNYERANQEAIHFISTKQFLEDWIRSKKITTAPGTSRRYEDTIDGFINHLGAKAERSLAAITPRDLTTYRRAGTSAIT